MHTRCYVQLCVHDYTCMSSAYPCPHGCHMCRHRYPRQSTSHIQSRKSNDLLPAYPASDATERDKRGAPQVQGYHQGLRLQSRHSKRVYEHKSLRPQRDRLVATSLLLAKAELPLLRPEVLMEGCYIKETGAKLGQGSQVTRSPTLCPVL